MAALLSKKTLLEHLAAAVVAIAATLLMTWPLARDASDHVLRAIYHWDAYTNAMIMGSRVDAALGLGPLSLYDNYFYAPLPNSIVFNENHFGLSLIFAPFYLLSGNPLWAYNLTLLVSLALSVFFTYLLVRRLTGNALAGMLSGVAFAFCPYVLFEIGRIQLVATQWIPLCFLFLHLAVEEQRLRYVVGLWLCYLLQIGTCLYYAMFLIPLLGLVGGVLLYRERPRRVLYYQLAAGGAVAAVVALGMVYPYFAARDAFDLERTLAFASGYDGEFSFFSNVHETNRTLTSLHHPSVIRGAKEEIAFPGFTVLAMLLVALGVALTRAWRSLGAHRFGVLFVRWLSLAALAFAVTVLSRSMLAGMVMLAVGIYLRARAGDPLPFVGRRGLYTAVLLLSVAMFLGLSVADWNGEPVRGLYYYFHTYFPGFNGIRKVSRQAVMTTFICCLLAGFGSAWLFSRLRQPWQPPVLFALLLGVSCYELRTFPHPMQPVWAGSTLPSAYRFVASLPPQDLVAALPQNDGVNRFWSDRGMALHNYLMLYHKHRSLNGQSSWMPPVNELVRRALIQLPDEAAWRVLASVGARHVIVHADELPPRRRQLPAALTALPQHYEQVFQEGAVSVFSLRGLAEPTLELLEMPALPEGATPIAAGELGAQASLASRYANNTLDGRLETYWAGGKSQQRGQYFELQLKQARPIVAVELDSGDDVMSVPTSFQLSVATPGGGWKAVLERPVLRLYEQQVYAPKQFVWRIVLPEPVVTDKVRVTLGQGVPGHGWVVREARVYEAGQ